MFVFLRTSLWKSWKLWVICNPLIYIKVHAISVCVSFCYPLLVNQFEDRTWCLSKSIWITNWVLFLPISVGRTHFEIDFWRLEIQFVELDFYNLIFQKSSTDQQGVSAYMCEFFKFILYEIFLDYNCHLRLDNQKFKQDVNLQSSNAVLAWHNKKNASHRRLHFITPMLVAIL